MNIRNAPTKLMKELGYGEGYLYNPAFAYVLHSTLIGVANCYILQSPGTQRVPPNRVPRPRVSSPRRRYKREDLGREVIDEMGDERERWERVGGA